MSKLMDERSKVLSHIIKSYGIEFGNHTFISIWDMAHCINNTWRASLFCNTKRFESISPDNRFVMKWYQLYELFPAIRKAAKKTGCMELRESYNNNTEYLMIDTPQG